MTTGSNNLFILGTRGIPAQHGGFETFAERFALHMTAQGWNVTVYCQEDPATLRPAQDKWRGINRIVFKTPLGAFGTVIFDLLAVLHASRRSGVMLVLGYNTALFNALLRVSGNPVITNMDGIEWKRQKWSFLAKVWLYLNEWIALHTSDSIVADHPEIANHSLKRRSNARVTTIPYGADAISQAEVAHVEALGLVPGQYFLSIGRMEPENNVVEIVRAHSSQRRSYKMVCLGKLDTEGNAYHREIVRFSSSDTSFPGAIYDDEKVSAIRFYAAAYCHGHSVGGTNPSLVEALGAGSAIIAHDNVYNKWVAGENQLYFSSWEQCAQMMTQIENDRSFVCQAKAAATRRHMDGLTWLPVLEAYETLCVENAELLTK